MRSAFNPITLRSGRTIAQTPRDDNYKVPGVVRNRWENLPPLEDIPEEEAEEVARDILSTEEDMLDGLDEVLVPPNPTEKELEKMARKDEEEAENFLHQYGLYPGSKLDVDGLKIMELMAKMFEDIKVMLEIGRGETKKLLEYDLELDDADLLDKLITFSEDFHASVRTFVEQYLKVKEKKNPNNPKTDKEAFKLWYNVVFNTVKASQDNAKIAFCSMMNYIGVLHPPMKEREGYIWAQANVCATLEHEYDQTTIAEIKKSQQNFFQRAKEKITKYLRGIDILGHNVYQTYMKLKDKWYIRMIVFLWYHRAKIVFISYFAFGLVSGTLALTSAQSAVWGAASSDDIMWIDIMHIIAQSLCEAATSRFVLWTTAGYVAEQMVYALSTMSGLSIVLSSKLEKLFGSLVNSTMKWIVPIACHSLIKQCIVSLFQWTCTIQTISGRLAVLVGRPAMLLNAEIHEQFDLIAKMIKSVAANPSAWMSTAVSYASKSVSSLASTLLKTFSYLKLDAYRFISFISVGVADFFNCAISPSCVLGKIFSPAQRVLNLLTAEEKSDSWWYDYNQGGILAATKATEEDEGWKQLSSAAIKRLTLQAMSFVKSGITQVHDKGGEFLAYIWKNLEPLVNSVQDMWKNIWESLFTMWSLFNYVKEVSFALGVKWRLLEWDDFQRKYAKDFIGDYETFRQLGGQDITNLIKEKKVELAEELVTGYEEIYNTRVKLMMESHFLDVLFQRNIASYTEAATLVPTTLANYPITSERQLGEFWQNLWTLDDPTDTIMANYLRTIGDPEKFLDFVTGIGSPYREQFGVKAIQLGQTSEDWYNDALDELDWLIDDNPGVMDVSLAHTKSDYFEGKLREWMGYFIPPIIWPEAREERKERPYIRRASDYLLNNPRKPRRKTTPRKSHDAPTPDKIEAFAVKQLLEFDQKSTPLKTDSPKPIMADDSLIDFDPYAPVIVNGPQSDSGLLYKGGGFDQQLPGEFEADFPPVEHPSDQQPAIQSRKANRNISFDDGQTYEEVLAFAKSKAKEWSDFIEDVFEKEAKAEIKKRGRLSEADLANLTTRSLRKAYGQAWDLALQLAEAFELDPAYQAWIEGSKGVGFGFVSKVHDRVTAELAERIMADEEASITNHEINEAFVQHQINEARDAPQYDLEGVNIFNEPESGPPRKKSRSEEPYQEDIELQPQPARRRAANKKQDRVPFFTFYFILTVVSSRCLVESQGAPL